MLSYSRFVATPTSSDPRDNLTCVPDDTGRTPDQYRWEHAVVLISGSRKLGYLKYEPNAEL